MIRRAGELSAIERLVALFEINWRLELALFPLFLPWVQVIENALEAVNLQRSVGPSVDPLIEEAWVDLAFAVTREAREDFDQGRHDKWLARIHSVAVRRPEWLDRWHYEQCLQALWRLDQPEALRRVEDWCPSPDQLVWLLRRASVLVEIGRFEEAERTAREVLSKVRHQLRGRTPQIAMMSLEGWVMKLLDFMSLATHPHSVGVEQEQFRDRWLQLASLHCDPRSITDALELTLRGTAPTLKAGVERKQGFDFGVTHTVEHFSSDYFSPIAPAFALLRLYEEAGIPMRVGWVAVSGSMIATAADWIAPYAPFWAAAALVRSGNRDEICESFDRVRVATLSALEVEALENWVLPAFGVYIEHSSLTPPDGTGGLPTRSSAALVELLSRLCLRLPQQQLDDVFLLLLQVYQRSPIVADPWLRDSIKSLVRRLFECASTDQFLSWLPQLLALPILSIDSQIGRDLLDPFSDIEFHYFPRLSLRDLQTHEIIGNRVVELLKIAAVAHGFARRLSMRRLVALFHVGLLAPKQTVDFGRALWSQIDPTNGLPIETDYTIESFLRLPGCSSAARRNCVREYLLSTAVPSWYQETADPDGTKWRKFQMGDRNSLVVAPIVAATRSFLGARHLELLVWTNSEIAQLLGKVVAWWDINKKGLSMSFTGNGLRDEAILLIPLFYDIIIPRLPRRATTEWATTRRVLEELENYSICTLTCSPAFLVAWPERAMETTTRIQKALCDFRWGLIVGAAEAIRCWARLSNARKVPSLPKRLLIELCMRVRYREQPGLEAILCVIGHIVVEAPKKLNKLQIDLVCCGLEFLLEETRLGADPNLVGVRIPKERRPEYRTWSAYLAQKLHRYFCSRGSRIPSVLEKWKTACEIDPLPEVRRVWKTWHSESKKR